MRIAILTEAYPSYHKPDARAFIHARARLYQEAGHQVRVYTEASPQTQLVDTFEHIQILRAQPTLLRQEIARYAPQVIAFHTPYAGTPIFQLATELAGFYPFVLWIHGYEAMFTAFYGYHHGWQRLASIPWAMRKLWSLRGFLPRCAAVVYVSQWLQGIAERGMLYRHPCTQVIHNPVDTQRFAPPDKNAIDQKSTERPLRGIALRGLGPKYGLDVAIKAYVGLLDTDLTIIGTGQLEAELQSLIASTGSNTELIARSYPHPQIPDLLRQYDYFVAPSRNETQGVAMCEAMACGLPVIASRVGGIPEFVRDGVDGYLIPREEPAALRQAVRNLIQERERFQQMGRNAHAHMRRTVDATVVIGQELELLDQVAT